MKRKYIGVWIDHAQARLVTHIEGELMQLKTIISHVDPDHRSIGHYSARGSSHAGVHSEKHFQDRRKEQLRRFYDRVLDEIPNCRALTILGPGRAKQELIRRMAGKGRLRADLLKMETASRLADSQILARVRKIADVDATSGLSGA